MRRTSASGSRDEVSDGATSGKKRVGVVAGHDRAPGRKRQGDVRVAVIDHVKDVVLVPGIRPQPVGIVDEPTDEPIDPRQASEPGHGGELQPWTQQRRRQTVGRWQVRQQHVGNEVHAGPALLEQVGDNRHAKRRLAHFTMRHCPGGCRAPRGTDGHTFEHECEIGERLLARPVALDHRSFPRAPGARSIPIAIDPEELFGHRFVIAALHEACETRQRGSHAADVGCDDGVPQASASSVERPSPSASDAWATTSAALKKSGHFRHRVHRVASDDPFVDVLEGQRPRDREELLESSAQVQEQGVEAARARECCRPDDGFGILFVTDPAGQERR
jgi:hypothetical protein